ncbi:MAG: TolC family protein [Syntrophales bacterium]|nr:TolC family protein [Syntrophales bacterium]
MKKEIGMNVRAQQLMTVILMVLAGNLIFQIPAACARETAAEKYQIDRQQGLPQIQSQTREEPLSLRACLNRALKDNPLVSEARLGVKAGGKNIDIAWGKHLPKLSLDGNYTKRQDPWPYIPAQSATILPHFSDEFSSWSVVMTLPIYQGGQVVAGVELAKIRKEIQESNLSLTKNELIANTVNTYNKILQLQKLREAGRSSVSAMETHRENSRLLYEVGRIAKVDLLKVEVQLANERQRLLALDEGIANMEGMLRYLMGEKIALAGEVTALSDKLTMPEFTTHFDLAWKTAQEKRPEYLIASTNIKEAELNKKIAWGRLFPSLNAFAGYLDQYGYTPYYKEANYFAGVNLSMPLFEKSFYDEIAKERILKNKAEKRLDVLENQIRLDIQTAISSIRESKNRILTAGQAIEQAEESFRIEQKRFESGAGVTVDLLFAQTAYITAVANHYQALFDYNAAIVSYRKVTGKLEEYLQ